MSHSQAESPKPKPPLVSSAGDSALTKPIEIFYSYAHEDQKLRNDLQKHLANMKRQGIISEWYDRDISAGSEWDDEIIKHLNSASVILLLISPDFMNSDYSNDVEVKHAMQRHEAGEATVIPIILRPVDWEGAPFSKLQGLPEGAIAVTSWDNQDEAFLSVAKGIRHALKELAKRSDDVVTDVAESQPLAIDYPMPSSSRWARWLEPRLKPVWIAAVMVLIILVVVVYKLKGPSSWNNFFSNYSASGTPAPTPTITPPSTATPTPSVNPTPSEPSTSPTPRPIKKKKPPVARRDAPTADPDEQAIRDFFKRKRKKNAHASPSQSTIRVTLDELREQIAIANKSRNARRVLRNGLRETGVNFVLTSSLEEELRAYAAGYSKAEFDDLIAVIRANDWKKSAESRLIPLQIGKDMDQLVLEFESISLANLDLDIRTYNDLLKKCSTMLGGVDTQVRRFDLESTYQRDWDRYRKPWTRGNSEYEGLYFKNEIDASMGLLKRFLKEIKSDINNAIVR
jgi:hypothetical protein